jgi:tetratricopeptide (TPR) repeat protein
VRHVVEGSVRRTGDRVRVTVQLIDAKSDAHLWSATYDRQLTDSLQVQEEIARQVSGTLLKSIRGMRPMSSTSRTAEAPAYDAYLRGNALLQRRSPADILGAMAAYHQALALDSAYAPAYAGLSRAYATWVLYGFRGGPDRYAAAARALALAERAVALDPRLAEAHHARADALGIAGAPSGRLFEQTRRALDLMPGSAELRMAYAHTLAQANRYGDALAHARQALELDPLSVGLRHSAMAIAVGARRYDLALREVERSRALDPHDPVAGVFGAFALLLSGRPEQCLTSELGPWVEIRALCLQAVGRQGDATVLVDSLSREIESGRYHDTYQFAHLSAFYARQGDVERALRWLEKGAALTPVMSYWELSSGLFGAAVRDPRFRTGLVRIRRAIAARLEADRRRTSGLLLEPLPQTAA